MVVPVRFFGCLAVVTVHSGDKQLAWTRMNGICIRMCSMADAVNTQRDNAQACKHVHI